MPPSDVTLIRGLEKRVDTLQREVNALKDLLNVHENWNTEVRKLLGKRVKITSCSGNLYIGELIWTDRFQVCIYDEVKKRRLTLNKGGIESTELA